MIEYEALLRRIENLEKKKKMNLEKISILEEENIVIAENLGLLLEKKKYLENKDELLDI